MVLSLDQPTVFTCPHCGRSFDAHLWLVVDARERPDLLIHIRAGRLHRLTCPHCGHTDEADAPLLLFRPDDTPPLVFSPARDTTEDEDKEQFLGLMGYLHQALGAAWRDEWLDNLSVIPRDFLPAALSEDPESAIQQLASARQSDGGPTAPAQFQADFQQVQAGKNRYLQQGDLSGLHEAAAAWERILQAPSFPAAPMRFQLGAYSDSGGIFLRLYWAQGRPENLDRAVHLFRTAVQHTPADSPDLTGYLNNLGLGLRALYERTGQISDLEEAIQVSQAAVDRTPTNSPHLATHLGNLGNILHSRYAHTGNIDDLEDAIRSQQAAVAQTPPDSPELPRHLNNLGNGLRDRYARTGQLTDLEEAVRVSRLAVQHTPPGSPDLPSYLDNLGVGLYTLYTRTGQLPHLEEAIQVQQAAVKRTPANSPELAGHLNNLGTSLRSRYDRTGEVADLEEALRAYHLAVQYCPPNSPNLPIFLNNLGTGRNIHYARTKQPADLEEIISIYQAAIRYAPPDSPILPTLLNNLGNGFSDRYDATGQPADLEESIRAWRRSVQLTQPDSPDLPRYLNNLGTGLKDLYAHTGQLAYLEEAIRAWQQALQQTAPDSPETLMYLTNLGNGLSTRFTQTGQPEDLEEAIQAYRTAVQHTAPHSPERLMRLNNLGTGLSIRYARYGQASDLEEAIHVWQLATQSTAHHSSDLAAPLNNLGTGLRERYIRSGLLADLEQAIDAYQLAVQHTPPNSPNFPTHLNNLGAGLRERYTRSGRLADLEEAIRIYRQAVASAPPDSPELPRLRNSLGNGLSDLYALTGELADLAEAILALETAVQRTPPDSLNLPGYLTNLGNAMLARYARSEKLADLEEAISHYRTAVQRTASHSPSLPGYLNNLGNGLRARYARADTSDAQKEPDEQEGIAAYEQACQLGLERRISEAIHASRNWSGWALSRHAWDEAVRAFQYGLTALEQLYQTQLLQQEQQSWQRAGQGLYAQAAYALARSGDLARAAATLEQGQARGLNDRLARDEANLILLQQQAPERYQAYQAAAGRLRQLEAAERQERIRMTDAAAPAPDWAAHRQQVQQTRAELQAAIAAIRQLEGYEQFLLPPRWEEVATAVQPGHPLAYLVTIPGGSLTLLLHQPTTSDDVALEPLWADAFTEAAFHAFLLKEENGREGGYLPGQFAGGAILQAALAEGLPLLGETLLAPLAQRLRALGLHRVTLIPGGRLNLLPLHAAQVTIDGQPAIFGDAFTVRYAPSARTLVASRNRLDGRADTANTLLAVGNPLPLPAGVRPLHYARPEAEEIALRFGGAPHLYCETAATHTAVTAAIPGTQYLHFACHGVFDPEQPLNSGLILSDGVRLTLRQVLDELSLRDARLVVLSACQTAVTDFNTLPDEVIGLPAGFLQAGAAGVLGSLWPVDDLSTALFMDHFYQLHWGNGKEGMSPAEALQATQRWLRQVTVAELSDLFAGYRAAAPDAPTGRMAYALAQEKYIDFTLAENQEDTPYAAPYFWAAFTFYGS